jgi:polyhydroxyalkanoate synthesis regulator phasin
MKQKTKKKAKPKQEHGEVKKILVDDITKNDWNPNEMTDEEFEMLIDNIEKVMFLDPPLVVPVDPDLNGGKKFRVVDGEHRIEAAREIGIEEIPVVIADPEIFDEDTQKKQTVRMNQIKGQHNIEKLNKLIDDLVSRGVMTPQEAAFEIGFANQDEFDLIREQARDSLPAEPGIRKEFDEKVKEAKSVDEIYEIVMKLMKKYGNSLVANYMIIAIDRGRNLWVKLDGSLVRKFEKMAKICLNEGVTFDSFIVEALQGIKAKEFIEEHREDLAELDDETEDIDDFFEDEFE